jgi:hypothetical protein
MGLDLAAAEIALQHRQEIRAKAPALALGRRMPGVIEKAHEEALHEVFGGIGRIAAAAHVSEDGRAIRAAQRLERGMRVRRVLASLHDEAPSRGVEAAQAAPDGFPVRRLWRSAGRPCNRRRDFANS